MVPKLKDLMGTRYIINDLKSKLCKVLDNNSAVDLSECKFGDDAEIELRKYYGKVEFSNSTEPELDRILKHNNTVPSYQNTNIKKLDMFVDDQNLIEVLTSIDPNYTYTLDIGYTPPANTLALAIIISMIMPEVKIDFCGSLSSVFKSIRNKWLPNRTSHKSYWCAMGTCAVKVDCINGKITDSYGSVFSEDDFVQNNLCIPYEFGTVRLWEDKEFERVKVGAIQVISKKLTPKNTMLNMV